MALRAARHTLIGSFISARRPPFGHPSERPTVACLPRYAPPACTAPLIGWMPYLWLGRTPHRTPDAARAAQPLRGSAAACRWHVITSRQGSHRGVGAALLRSALGLIPGVAREIRSPRELGALQSRERAPGSPHIGAHPSRRIALQARRIGRGTRPVHSAWFPRAAEAWEVSPTSLTTPPRHHSFWRDPSDKQSGAPPGFGGAIVERSEGFRTSPITPRRVARTQCLFAAVP